MELSPSELDDIISDRKTLSIKQSMMSKLRWNSLLSSMSTVSTFIGGPLTAAGLTMAAPALFTAGAVVSTVSMGLLATGALFIALAVASSYAASRIWQGNQFDNFELNAQSTAHHLVKELRANNMCLTQERPEQCRADGKSWVETSRASAPGQGVTL